MHFAFGSIWGAQASDGRPWALHYRSSKWFILLTVTIAVFTDIFLYAVIVPVIPFALKNRAHVKEEDIQSWVSILIAVYGGALAAFSPICGWVADQASSRRAPMVAGLLTLAGATLMLNLGPSITVLVLGRILQGISAAVVWVVGLALLADTVDESEMGQTMGYVFTAMSVAILLGPLLGGVVFDKGGYNDVYAMAYVLIGVDIALRMLMIEKKVAKKWEQIEETPGDGTDVATISDIGTFDAASTPTTLKFSTTFEKEEPIIDNIRIQDTDMDSGLTNVASGPTKRKLPAVVTLLKSRRLLCALWGTVVISTLMTQFDSVLPLFVKETFGWGSLGAGLVFIPLIIPSFISPIIGWAIDKYGGRYFCVAGFIGFVPFEILLRLVNHNSIRQKVLLCALLVGIGFSLDLAMPPIMVEISSVVEQKEKTNPGLFGKTGAYAQAYGLFNFAWAVGCLIGPIWAGYVKESAGWGTMSWSLALLALVTSVPAGIWTGGSIFSKGKKSKEHVLDDDERNADALEMGTRTTIAASGGDINV
ncbi:hypothetical protein FKW77_010444 [Venturia effusa]|uniref:Major facilitator superfamily (MFS) profile domain-containing protein n=1 Tax=Venturia effusa TaxID=50376 RepID=A0A517L6G4_9PEZI|nr:hypothetical protein FKW77_010444 [Venturia effusa]